MSDRLRPVRLPACAVRALGEHPGKRARRPTRVSGPVTVPIDWGSPAASVLGRPSCPTRLRCVPVPARRHNRQPSTGRATRSRTPLSLRPAKPGERRFKRHLLEGRRVDLDAVPADVSAPLPRPRHLLRLHRLLLRWGSRPLVRPLPFPARHLLARHRPNRHGAWLNWLLSAIRAARIGQGSVMRCRSILTRSVLSNLVALLALVDVRPGWDSVTAASPVVPTRPVAPLEVCAGCSGGLSPSLLQVRSSRL